MEGDERDGPDLGFPEGAPQAADLGMPGSSVRPPHDGLAMPGPGASAPETEDDWDLEANLAGLQDWIAWATRGRPLDGGGHLRLLGLGVTPNPRVARARYDRLRLELDDWRSSGGANATWAEQALEQDEALGELEVLVADHDRWTAHTLAVRTTLVEGLQRQLERKWTPYWKPPEGDMDIDPGEWRAITLDAQTTREPQFGLSVAADLLDGYRQRLKEQGVTFSGIERRTPWGDPILGIEDLPRSMKENEAAIVGPQFVQTMYRLEGALRSMPGELAALLADAALEMADAAGSGEAPEIAFWRLLWRGGDKELRLGPDSSVFSLEQLRTAADGQPARIEAALSTGLLEAWLSEAMQDQELAEHAPKGGGFRPRETAEQLLWRIGEKRLLVGKTTFTTPTQLRTALETAATEQLLELTLALTAGRIAHWLRLAQGQAILAEKVDAVRNEQGATAPSSDRLLWALGSTVFRLPTASPSSLAELVQALEGEPLRLVRDLKSGRLKCWLEQALDRSDLAGYAASGPDRTVEHAEVLLWRLGEKRLTLNKKVKLATVAQLESLLMGLKSLAVLEPSFATGRVAAWLRIAQDDEPAARNADPWSSPFPAGVDHGWVWLWRQGHKHFSVGDVGLSKPSQLLLLASDMARVRTLYQDPAFAHWLRLAHDMGRRADLVDQHRQAGRIDHGAVLLLWSLGHAGLPVSDGSAATKEDLLRALDRRDEALVSYLHDGKLAAWLSVSHAITLPALPRAADPWLSLAVVGWCLGSEAAWLGSGRAESLSDFVDGLNTGAFQADAVRELVQEGVLEVWPGFDPMRSDAVAQLWAEWDTLTHPQEHLARALGRRPPELTVTGDTIELGRIRELQARTITVTLSNHSAAGTAFVRFRSDSSVFDFPGPVTVEAGQQREIEIEYLPPLGTTSRSVCEAFEVVADGRPIPVTVLGQGGVHPGQWAQAAALGALLTALALGAGRLVLGLWVGSAIYPPNAAPGAPLAGTEAALLAGGWGLGVAVVVISALLYRFGPGGARRRSGARTSPEWLVLLLVFLGLLAGAVRHHKAVFRRGQLHEARAEERQVHEAIAALETTGNAQDRLIAGVVAFNDRDWRRALSLLALVVGDTSASDKVQTVAAAVCTSAGRAHVTQPLTDGNFMGALEAAQRVPEACGNADVVARIADRYLDRLLAGGPVGGGEGTSQSRKLAYSVLLARLFPTGQADWPAEERRRRLAHQILQRTGARFQARGGVTTSYTAGLVFKDHWDVSVKVEEVKWIPGEGLQLTVIVRLTGDKDAIPAKCKPVLVADGRARVLPKTISGCSSQFGEFTRLTVLYRQGGPPNLLRPMAYESGIPGFPTISFGTRGYLGGANVTPLEAPSPLR